jgi:uncharacterized tellurite resistance protein B-like protein
MNLKDLIYAKTGITIDLKNLASDPDGQALMTSLLALAAKSDGGISPDEMTRMVELLRERFGLQPGEALNMIARATDEIEAIAEGADLDELLSSVNDDLALPHKEELLLMLLHVISADNEKDVAEMKFLAAVVDGLKIPGKIMDKVYARYFEDRRKRSV